MKLMGYISKEPIAKGEIIFNVIRRANEKQKHIYFNRADLYSHF